MNRKETDRIEHRKNSNESRSLPAEREIMKNIDFKAENGFSDKGVKNEQDVCLRDADGENSGMDNEKTNYADSEKTEEMPVASEIELHTDTESDEQLDAEFEELIRTRYKNAYRRRAESLIRRRLRSTKHKKDEKEVEKCDEKPTDSNNESNNENKDGERKKLQILQNQKRPSENGIGTSVGMYSRADVSKLTGKEIREILSRVGRGEKIRFS